MFDDVIKVVKKSIFPVFYGKPSGNIEIGIIGIIGTGFFIDDTGHFITAYHVVKNKPQGSNLYYFGNVPDNPTLNFIKIEEIISDAKRDIFIGKVSEGYLPGLKLNFEKTDIGKSICFGGYPYNHLSQNQDGSVNVSQAIQYWEPTTIVDHLDKTVDERNIVGFYTKSKGLPGLSGGPVFALDGRVCGFYVASVTTNAPIPFVNGAVQELLNVQDILAKVIKVN